MTKIHVMCALTKVDMYVQTPFQKFHDEAKATTHQWVSFYQYKIDITIWIYCITRLSSYASIRNPFALYRLPIESADIDVNELERVNHLYVERIIAGGSL